MMMEDVVTFLQQRLGRPAAPEASTQHPATHAVLHYRSSGPRIQHPRIWAHTLHYIPRGGGSRHRADYRVLARSENHRAAQGAAKSARLPKLEAPKTHLTKAETPTMGGLIVLGIRPGADAPVGQMLRTRMFFSSSM